MIVIPPEYSLVVIRGSNFVRKFFESKIKIHTTVSSNYTFVQGYLSDDYTYLSPLHLRQTKYCIQCIICLSCKLERSHEAFINYPTSSQPKNLQGYN